MHTMAMKLAELGLERSMNIQVMHRDLNRANVGVERLNKANMKPPIQRASKFIFNHDLSDSIYEEIPIAIYIFCLRIFLLKSILIQ